MIQFSKDVHIINDYHIGVDKIYDWLGRNTKLKLVYELVDIATCIAANAVLFSISDVLILAQAAHETGYGTTGAFSSQLWIYSNNPAGLNKEKDRAGTVFRDRNAGFRAQCSHLLAYAVKPSEYTPDQEMLVSFSPRRYRLEELGWLGIAPTWQSLGGKWTKNKNYGLRIVGIANSIMKDMDG